MTEFFISLVNMSITASWLIIAVIVLRVLLKKAPKAIRCLLWGLVAIKLVCPFSLESVLSLIPSPQTVSPDILLSPSPSIESGIPAVNGAVNTVLAKTLTPSAEQSVNPMQVLAFAACLLWLVGLAAMLIYALASYLRLSGKVGVSMPLSDKIMLCDAVKSPFILGVFRPIIYLPSDMSEEQRSSVIAHETAHLRRRDHWWKPLGFLLLSVYWFNPLCWAAYLLLCKDIELACDERVIRDMDTESKKSYSNALLSCSVDRRFVTACPLAFGEVGVKERIKGVLSYKKPAFWVVAVALVASAVTAICLMTSPKRSDGSEDTSKYIVSAGAATCDLDYIDVEVERLDRNNDSVSITLKYTATKAYADNKSLDAYIGNGFFCYLMDGEAEQQLEPADAERAFAGPVLLSHTQGASVLVTYPVTDYYKLPDNGIFRLETIITTSEDDLLSYAAYLDFELVSKKVYPGLDAKISMTILEENAGKFYPGECETQGHIILETKQSGRRITAYCLTEYTVFGFENGCFVPVSGCSVPAAYTFNLRGGNFELLKAEYAQDGSNYVKSIRAMFPGSCAERAIYPSDADKSAMKLQQRVHAEAYLDAIDREAEILLQTPRYTLLSDLGVGVELSNRLDEIRKEQGLLGDYPYWVGTREQLEDGVRYVYETSLYTHNGQSIIKYDKYEYNGNHIAELHLDAETGEVIMTSSIPQQGEVNVAVPHSPFNAETTAKQRDDGKIIVHASESKTAVKLTDAAFREKYGFDVYSFGVSSVEVKVGGEYIDAASALNSGSLKPDKLVKMAKADAKQTGQFKDGGSEAFISYDDGGSVLYPAGGYALLKLNKLSDVPGGFNKDIYIGTPELDINEIF